MKKLGVIATFLLFVCLSGALAQTHEGPLPGNLKIEPPGVGVPPQLASLSGIWEGTWEHPGVARGVKKMLAIDVMGHGIKVVIQKINPPEVRAIYSWSGSSSAPGGWFRVRDAALAGDTVVLKWGLGGKRRLFTLYPSKDPRVANATLEIEGEPYILKAKLQKR